MSHSYEGPNGTRFSFNSDLSGNIDILHPNGSTFEVDGQDVQELILEQLRQEILNVVGDVDIVQLLRSLQRLVRDQPTGEPT